jgi:hypothetical protein
MGDGVWRRNAYFGEADTFDPCFGHQPGNGEYHNHVQPVCLRAQLGDNVVVVKSTRVGTTYKEKPSAWTHSPILGWALDGYPIYGPYGYSNPKDPKSPVRRMVSSFRLRQITARTSLPDWALPNHPGVSRQLNPSQYGPAVDRVSPLGRYVEDFEYSAGLGDLDQYNGRLAVTPEFPEGTYAYFLTIDGDGLPAFPYIFGGEYYGAVKNGFHSGAPSDAKDYFTDNAFVGEKSSAPLLASWKVSQPGVVATIVNGKDPAAGPVSTWAGGRGGGRGRGGPPPGGGGPPPDGVGPPPEGRGRGRGPGGPGGGGSNGVSTPASADVQRIRESASAVYVESTGLPSYTIGPWFAPGDPGGVFQNMPAKQNARFEFPMSPAPASPHVSTGMGPVGVWVNGVAAFNFLDGATYSNSRGSDVGGGRVAPGLRMVSAASGEGGPAAPGSLMTITPTFGAVLVADGAKTVVTVTDAQGTARVAEVSLVSPERLNFRLPDETALGLANVVVSAGSGSTATSVNVVASYPHLFEFKGAAVKAGTRLVLEGSGYGKAGSASAIVGGESVVVTSVKSEKGVDRYEFVIPGKLTGKGPVEATVKVDGRVSNSVGLVVR